MWDTFDTAITVYNSYFDATAKTTRWKRQNFPAACSWYWKRGVHFNDAGLSADESYMVRIRAFDLPPGYVSIEAWKQLVDHSGVWTLQNGDIVAKGELDIDITSPTDITAQYPSFTIGRVYDNRRGPEFMQHFRIEGE